MLSAVCLPQVRAEACISLQASWEQVNSWNYLNHVRWTKSSIKKWIIVRQSVRSMFGEQTFAQLRMAFRLKCSFWIWEEALKCSYYYINNNNHISEMTFYYLLLCFTLVFNFRIFIPFWLFPFQWYILGQNLTTILDTSRTNWLRLIWRLQSGIVWDYVGLLFLTAVYSYCYTSWG